MAETYLNRADAPLSEKVWNLIDTTVTEAAKSQIVARRLLYAEGPYGLGLKGLPGPDVALKSSDDNVAVVAGVIKPLVQIQARFTLAARDIAAYEQTGLPLDLGRVATAAIACARQEDAILFSGNKEAGVEGLLAAKGVQKVHLKSWKEVGTATDDLIAAVTKLDAAGFHGPYALALGPERYNLLFRRFPQADRTELEHLQTLITAGVFKAAAIGGGGVLIASGRQYASIILGQDLLTSFVGPAGRDYDFAISETLALRLQAPSAVLSLGEAG